MLNLNDKLQSRTIRVFLSSTFEDMQEERTHLMNVVFLRLRSMARQRGVTFTEVDLRWGIVEHAAQNGKVLRLCLREIDQCQEKRGELSLPLLAC